MSNAFIPVVQFFRWNAASAIFIDQCDEVKNFEKPFARLGRTGKNGNKPAERKCMLHFLQYDLTVFPFKNVNFIQEQEKQGVKVLLHIPKDGVPMAPGKDTVKFMQSTKGKRILHWLYKKLGAKI